jgi:hypothetical protein
LPFASELVPIDPNTGLAPIPVQLYGYRQEFPGAELEIDPLLTGIFGKPFATSTIVSFGYAKTIDIGGGGAILTQDKSLNAELEKLSYFPGILRDALAAAIDGLHAAIMEKKREYEEIENRFGGLVCKLDRPLIPWRFIARFGGFGLDKIEDQAHALGWKFSRNYPPLPGVTDLGAIRWGKGVINIWK